MDSSQIAAAARGVALDLACAGTSEQDRIANAFEKFADLIDPQGTHTESPTPTSELLTEAADAIHDLGITREVSRPNGWRYAPLVRELQDRAAAFKACEDEGKS